MPLGIAAAYRLGADYVKFDDFAEDFFSKYCKNLSSFPTALGSLLWLDHTSFRYEQHMPYLHPYVMMVEMC